ncbi:ABC transporter permease [Brevundimonas sp. 2R-24]|uniref:ABC transporter permease n=1 Tax=Peiella sedimenti TaxID=3061083 RepID=A0ABT8SHZ9_9CAUL|nr:ABC transporter permease [Caulobacteraceae bacterium XZ-24]
MSLALSTLIYEWRRYMAAVVALAFSGLLILAQVGMFMGIGRAFTAQIDRARADVMILAPGATGLGNGPSGVPRRILPTIYRHPDVVQVAPLDGSGGRFQNIVPADEAAEAQNPNQRTGAEGQGGGQQGGERRRMEFVNVTVVDPIPGYVTVPTDYSDELLEALRRPYAVAVDETALRRLGVQLGDKALYNGKTIEIAAVTRGYPNMMQATLIMSRDTLRMLGEADTGPRVGPLMVKLRDASRADAVAAQLNAQAGGQYRAWTRTELARANANLMFQEQIIGVMLGFSVFLGLLIGIAITWQTLRGAIMANIKEFASLRALGVSMPSLRRVIMELSFWVGVAGILAAGALTWGVGLLAGANGVPMAFSAFWIGMVSVLLLIIAIASGFLSLGVLKNSQPADLLR